MNLDDDPDRHPRLACEVADVCPEHNDCEKCEIAWYSKMYEIKEKESHDDSQAHE